MCSEEVSPLTWEDFDRLQITSSREGSQSHKTKTFKEDIHYLKGSYLDLFYSDTIYDFNRF